MTCPFSTYPLPSSFSSSPFFLHLPAPSSAVWFPSLTDSCFDLCVPLLSHWFCIHCRFPRYLRLQPHPPLNSEGPADISKVFSSSYPRCLSLRVRSERAILQYLHPPLHKLQSTTKKSPRPCLPLPWSSKEQHPLSILSTGIHLY